ncbi:MAG: DUF58 domain-containing protein [Vicinamibacteria bacterium]|nr:DUF58 domain-containing protein [Vicinamibacteria bacterium]
MSPSRHRGFLLFAAGLLFVLGLQLRIFALAALGLAFAGWTLAGALWTRRQMALLSLSREAADSAFEDDTAPVTLVVDNRGRDALHLLLLGDTFGPGVAFRHRLLEPGPLPGRRRRRLRYRAHCGRGFGAFTLGPLTLELADPLGLVHHQRPFGAIAPFVVYPRAPAVAGLERLGSRRSFALEDRSAARPGASLAYLGTREYRAGDDVRRIHWPATARRGVPVVREHELDLTPQLSLFVDLARAHRAGTGRRSTREYVLRAACGVVEAAARRGDLVELVASSARLLQVPPGRGAAHVALCWEALVRAGQDGTRELLEVADAHASRIPRGSVAALLFATIRVEPAALHAAFAALRAREVAPLAVFVDSESFAPMSRLALHPELAAARRDELRALLRAWGVAGAVIGADDDLGGVLGRAEAWTGFA